MGLPTRAPARARLLAITATLALAGGLLTLGSAAQADTAPPVTTDPTTVSSDPLPTPQINGVVWSQVIVGNVDYVAGNFTSARPAGSAAGTNETPRSYLLAYDVTTGALLPWAPVLDAQVRALAVSPDQKRLYAVGDFTTVNGVSHKRVAGFDLPTGALSATFAPTANATVYAVAATNSTVYIGGSFTSVSQQSRTGTASVLATTGKATTWNPVITTGHVFAFTISPDATKVVIGGSFETLNGSSNPGYGLGMVDATTGANLPFAANSVIRNAGPYTAIYSLTSDSDGVWGTGYRTQLTGSLEGTFHANWNGDLQWIADCHGDEYSVALRGDSVFIAGHPHFCGNIGDGFPEENPQNYHRALSFTQNATGTLGFTDLGYVNFPGKPAPTLKNWFPDINAGTFTGQGQGPWSVAANADYVVYGGEFTQVNATKQQGLVRFAARSIAPNLDGPRLSGDNLMPTLVQSARRLTVSWPADWDRDDPTLTYYVYRDGKTGTPAYTTTATSREWDRPTLSWVDAPLDAGSTHTYRIRAVDSAGNSAWGTTVTGTVTATDPQSIYATVVIGDQPTNFWRLGGTTTTSIVQDAVGRSNAFLAGVTPGPAGPVINDPMTAATFNGASKSHLIAGQRVWRDDTVSIEAWVNTTSATGGKIVAFGDSSSGASTDLDRALYMTPAGNLAFGVYPESAQAVQSPLKYNDGKWHYAVATLGPAGMRLYVDGQPVASNPAVTKGESFWGFWGIGGDTSTRWVAPFFTGSIADVAIYTTPLTDAQVLRHWGASGR
jgi:hypothetical protein